VGGGRLIVPRPPTLLPYWAELHDGRLVLTQPRATDASDAVFTLTRFGLAGDTVFHRELHYRPVPFSDAELDSVAADAARGPVAVGPTGPLFSENADVVARALRDAMDFPPFRQPIVYADFGEDQSVWLFRDDFASDVDRWIVLDSDGLPRGEVELPANTRVHWIEGDLIWAVVPGEFDVPWLVRYRIGPG
jgi:hypothetical protein